MIATNKWVQPAWQLVIMIYQVANSNYISCHVEPVFLLVCLQTYIYISDHDISPLPVRVTNVDYISCHVDSWSAVSMPTTAATLWPSAHLILIYINIHFPRCLSCEMLTFVQPVRPSHPDAMSCVKEPGNL